MHPDKPEQCGPCQCRTINLAKTLRVQKPEIGIYDKCGAPCPRTEHVAELPLHPSCIRTCTKEELLREKCGKRVPRVRVPPPHGKLMYLVKAGILLGTVYFTHKEGLWSDQATAAECVKRWKAYLASLSLKTPPVFDECGHVVGDDAPTLLSKQMYGVYKAIITTCFTGVVEVPKIAVCSYLAYKKERALKAKEERNKIKT